MEYRHELADPKSGYAYVYTKTVRLTAGKPQMTIEHNLKNTGTKAISTNVYNHGFFMLDSQPTGPDFTVTFPFDAKGTREMTGLAEVKNKQIVYLKELQDTTLAGGGPASAAARCSCNCPPAGGGVPGAAGGSGGDATRRCRGGGGRRAASTLIEGYSATDPARLRHSRGKPQDRRGESGSPCDRPLWRINFWSVRTTVCPEAYVEVKADPGKETSWKLTYDFYGLPAAGR